MTFGEWLSGKLGAEGWTQRQLAEYAGCSTDMIRSLVAGRRLPSFDMAIKVCLALACELEEASCCDEFLFDKRDADYHQTKRKQITNDRKHTKVCKPAVPRPPQSGRGAKKHR